MPANTKPISSRNAAQEAFENDKLAMESMNAARAASQMHPVTKAVTEPLRRMGEGVKKKGMKSGGRTKKGC
jgi:hypothetical protein